MIVELKYIFETKDGFKFVRDTPLEVISIMSETYQELSKIATGENDLCNCFINTTNKYFPEGSIRTRINGEYKSYSLRTQLKEIK